MLVVLVLLLSSFTSTPRPDGDQTLTIRVAAADPSETLDFEGSYIFKTDSTSLQTVKRQTPFTAQARSKFVAGIFHKLAGKSDLQVKVFTSVNDVENFRVSGSGAIIIVGTVSQKEPYQYSVQALD